MNPYVMGMLAAFSGAVFVGFFVTMWNSNGRCDINAYGEGWIETALAGTLFTLGAIELYKYQPSEH